MSFQLTSEQYSSHHLRPQMDAGQDVYEVLRGELKHNLLQYNLTSSKTQDQSYLALLYRLRQLSDLLEDSADYLYALHLAQHQPAQAGPWLWRLLADDGEMRLGLQSVYANRPTPLHNHPGKCGAGLVLSGNLLVDQFNQQQLQISADYPIVKLAPTSCGYYQPGQMPGFTINDGNVQRLQATDGRAVLLVIQLKCSKDQQSYWYYSISPENGDKSFFAQRLAR